jgi:phosphatidylethanolamine/phosphatidyl-N-methylethanolamine N-methyltransferase
VLTVVPDPHRTLDEMARVVRPGGEIVLVNHIGAESGLMAALEAWLGRRAAALGWRPEFPWSIVGDWLARRPDVRLLERRKLAPLDLFTLVRLRRA